MSLRQGFLVSWADSPSKYRKVFADAADAGFDYVELNMEGAFHRTQIEPTSVQDAATAQGLDITVHLPYRFDMCSPHEYVRKGACRELEAAIDTAIEMDAEKGVIHADSLARPGRVGEEPIRKGIRSTVRRITDYGSERGFEVVTENLKGLVDAAELPALLADAHPEAKMCLDTGHAFVTGMSGEEQGALLREYGDRISHIHLNDTRVESDDEHLPVGLGRVDFEPLAAALVETDWTGTCTHEVFTFDYSRVHRGNGKPYFDKLLATRR
ncbi:sugar phosphate isomerase/epimerase family protein [Haloferax sp. S1W]|uniref:sugar phosphate isomerase/epimerase family protein n=1 Tax=Haloferax sp. S1W TaxID=3377110 RepID=UPI0037C92F29